MLAFCVLGGCCVYMTIKAQNQSHQVQTYAASAYKGSSGGGGGGGCGGGATKPMQYGQSKSLQSSATEWS